jgi:hypothetical protein
MWGGRRRTRLLGGRAELVAAWGRRVRIEVENVDDLRLEAETDWMRMEKLTI